MANGPRIRNISPDELRRLFEAPEIQKPPSLSVSEAASLAEAFASRERKSAEDQARIADIERNLELAEKEKQLGEQLIQPPAQAPELQQAREEEITKLETQIDPISVLRQQRAAEAATIGAEAELAAEERAFARKKELEQIKFENKKALKEMEKKAKSGSSSNKLSGIVQRQTAKADSVDRQVNEFERVVSLMSETGLTDITGAAKVTVDKMTGGFLGKLLKVDPEITSFEQARDALGRRLYKDVSGDVGNIAQQEGRFAKRLIPTAQEAPGLRTQKINRIKRLQEQIRAATARLQAGVVSGAITPDDAVSSYKGIVSDAMDGAIAGMPEETQEAARANELTPAEMEELEALRLELGGQ